MCLAVPGKIVEIRDDGPAARIGAVDFGGVLKEINLSLVPEARMGDYVLVHAGFAINTIDEDEAAKVFEYLREIDELDGLVEDGSRDESDFESRGGAGGPKEDDR